MLKIRLRKNILKSIENLFQKLKETIKYLNKRIQILKLRKILLEEEL